MCKTDTQPEAPFMRRALALAGRGRGRVEPNPMVGAVIVRDGQVIGEGWHAQIGGPHAEAAALEVCRSQGNDPAGATAYITLEPCSHHGKTPPCAEALIEAKVARVVTAMQDPDPRVSGRGITLLRDTGVAVEVGLNEDEARELNAPYLKRQATGRPWVIAKWAQTIDGKIAAATGDSKWISGEDSRQHVHRLRARVDAIMVGVGTAIADDPSLTARNVEVLRVAQRVVIDPHGRLPKDAKLYTDGGPAPLIYPDPATALDADHDATNVLVEGGGALLGSMFDAGLIDQALVFVAPKLAGDADALDALRGRSIQTIDQCHKLTLRNVERIGDDVLLDYRTTPSP